jgi:esterase/lipase superfamily enzyme
MNTSTDDLGAVLKAIDRENGAGAERLRPYFEVRYATDDHRIRILFLAEALYRLHSVWNRPDLTIEYAKLYVPLVEHCCDELREPVAAQTLMEVAGRLLSIEAYDAAQVLTETIRSPDRTVSFLLEEVAEAARTPHGAGHFRRAAAKKVTRATPRRDANDPSEPGKWFLVPIGATISRHRHAQNKGNPYTRFTNRLVDKPEYATINVSVPERRTLKKVHRDPSEKRKWEEIDPAEYYLVRRIDLEKDLFATREALLKAHLSGQRPCVLFVHGWWQSVADAAFHCAQMISDAQINCDPMIYCWPSSDYRSACEYADLGSPIARQTLASLIRSLAKSKSGPLWVIGHSLGCRLVLRSLELLSSQKSDAQLSIEQLILASPDVPTTKIDGLLKSASKYSSSITIFSSTNDLALYAAEILPYVKKQGTRAGRLPADYGNQSICVDTSRCNDRLPTLHHHSDFTESHLALTTLKARLATPNAEPWQPSYLNGAGGLLEIDGT